VLLLDDDDDDDPDENEEAVEGRGLSGARAADEELADTVDDDACDGESGEDTFDPMLVFATGAATATGSDSRLLSEPAGCCEREGGGTDEGVDTDGAKKDDDDE
jgi:hypothetical protein